jgi:hypothetical protein
MKMIIDKDGIKRELEAPFSMCMSRDDLDAFICELRERLAVMRDTSDESSGSVHGWFRVDPSHPSSAPSSTKPLAWTDLAPSYKRA